MFQQVASQTHTWMGESIKVGLRYAQPFWRNADAAGTIFSNVGPIPEMYDHSNFQDQFFSLVGFFNGSYYSISKHERLEMVLRQLRKYYGSQVDHYEAYEEQVWRDETHTFVSYDGHVLPHQNNGHTIYQQPYLNGKLYVSRVRNEFTISGVYGGGSSQCSGNLL